MKSKTLLIVVFATLLVSCTPTESPIPTGIPADIPIYSEHSNVEVFGDSFSYKAFAELHTVNQFYQTEMINLGWTESQKPLIYGDTEIILHYKKAGQEALIDLLDSRDFIAVGIGVGIEP